MTERAMASQTPTDVPSTADERAEMAEFLRIARAEVAAGLAVPALEALDEIADKNDLKSAAKSEMIEFLRASLAEAKVGQTVPALEAIDEMIRELELKLARQQPPRSSGVC